MVSMVGLSQVNPVTIGTHATIPYSIHDSPKKNRDTTQAIRNPYGFTVRGSCNSQGRTAISPERNRSSPIAELQLCPHGRARQRVGIVQRCQLDIVRRLSTARSLSMRGWMASGSDYPSPSLLIQIG